MMQEDESEYWTWSSWCCDQTCIANIKILFRIITWYIYQYVKRILQYGHLKWIQQHVFIEQIFSTSIKNGSVQCVNGF